LTARRDELTGFALVATSAVLFSGKAVLVKLAYPYGVDPLTLLALRMALALPVFAALSTTEELAARRAGQRVSAADRAAIVLLGVVGYYGASLLDFLGLADVSAGLERLVLYVYPTLTVLLGAALFGQRIGRREWIAIGASYAGILLAFGGEAQVTEGGHVVRGTLLVSASALAYAVYLVGSGRVLPRVGSARFVSQAMTAAGVAVLAHYAAARPFAALFALPREVLWIGVVMALFATIAPTLLVGAGMRRIGPSRVAIAGMIGPASTIVLARIVLSERFGALQAAGTALVLLGVTQLAIAPAPRR